MKSHWVEHQGQRVMIAEYSNFGMNTAALNAEIEELRAELMKYPPNSTLVISNVAGTTVTRANVQALMNMLAFSNKIVRKRAVVGMTPLSTQLLGMFNKLTGRARFHSFDTLEHALNWIVEE